LLPFATGILLADSLELQAVACAPLALLGLAMWIAGSGRLADAGEFLLGLGVGALALALRLHAPVPGALPLAAPLELVAPRAFRLLEAPRRLGHACSARAWLYGARPGRAQLQLPRDACDLLPGQRAVAPLELQRTRTARNPGAGSPETWGRRRGVRARARVRSERAALLAAPPRGLRVQRERLRRHAAQQLDAADAGPTASGALLRALVLGDRAGLEPATRDAFARAGTAHLLAVSGLHVGWVFGLLRLGLGAFLRRIPALGLLRRARGLATGAAWVGAASYAFLCGPGVPALRASAMAAAGALALMGGRRASAWNGLALAGMVVLASSPAALFDVGAWLSFAAVAGLLVWRVPPRPLAGLVHATLAASLATAPIVALTGIGPWPSGSVAANLLAVPVFGLLVLPAGLLALCAILVCAPLAAPACALARCCAGLGLALVERLGSPDLLALSRWPFALAAAAGLTGFALRALARTRRRGPLALALAGAALSVALLLVAPRNRAVTPEVIFLDVGHGDAVLLRSAEQAWLVDAGGRLAGYDAGRRVVRPALRALGVRRLALLVITHADADHIGGAAAILRGVRVDEVWLTAAALRASSSRELRAAAAQRGVRLRVVAAGTTWRHPSGRLELLWPPSGLRSSSRNSGSIVVRAQLGARCVLLPGDVSANVERQLAASVGACDVLALAHHGSRSSSHPRWLDALRPGLAIASAGGRAANSLPHERVRSRLAQRGIPLYVTREHGALRVGLGRPWLEVASWQPARGWVQRRRFTHPGARLRPADRRPPVHPPPPAPGTLDPVP
jgi:competence protein ComEC